MSAIRVSRLIGYHSECWVAEHCPHCSKLHYFTQPGLHDRVCSTTGKRLTLRSTCSCQDAKLPCECWRKAEAPEISKIATRGTR